MRDMVEHGHTSGSRQTTVLSGCSSPRRFTRWISVATPITEPAGASLTARMMASVEPTWSASSTTSWAHSGWTTHEARRGAPARNAATCAGRKRWCTEQWPFHKRSVTAFTSVSSRPPRVRRGSQIGHVGGRVAELVAGVAPEVLVGEEEDLVAAGGRRLGAGRRGPSAGRPGRWTTCRPPRRGGRRRP